MTQIKTALAVRGDAEKLNASVAAMRGAGAVVDSIVGDVTDQATVARVIAGLRGDSPLGDRAGNSRRMYRKERLC